ncbi:MAG: cohesin domain-containing protein, partial [Candidatus Poribacteria bacterium]
NIGYHVADVLVDGSSVGAVGTYTFTNVTANHTISASFSINTFTITASAGANGSIIPSGTLNVNSGTDLIFAIIANVGYHIADVLVDGASVGVVNIYTFTNVTANHTISATFEATAVLVPDISANVTDGKFVDTKIGNPSNPLFVNMTNKGTADLNILDIVLSDSNNYSIDLTSNPNSNGSTKTKIAPNAIWGFAVIFKPSSLGAKPAVLSIKSDDPDTATLNIPLTGNGIGLKGDVNDDGQVRSNDAILVLRIAASLLEPNAYQKWSADMNNDGNIRSNDAILVLRASAGLGAPAKNIIVNRVSIALGEAYGTAGDTVTIPIVVDNKNALSGGDLVIKYDNSVLLASEIKSDDSILLSANISGGTVRVSFAGVEGLKNKEIATIKFKVLANNFSPLSFEIAELYSSDSLPVKTKAVNGKFT